MADILPRSRRRRKISLALFVVDLQLAFGYDLPSAFAPLEVKLCVSLAGCQLRAGFVIPLIVGSGGRSFALGVDRDAEIRELQIDVGVGIKQLLKARSDLGVRDAGRFKIIDLFAVHLRKLFGVSA